MHVMHATNAQDWESFVTAQQFPLFLQSWTMGEVYRDIGQEPIRIEVREDGKIVGVCQAIVVPARRGKHLMVQYGPLLANPEALEPLLNALKDIATKHGCSFIRLSPFWIEGDPLTNVLGAATLPSPMHLLSEYTWYIPLRMEDRWRAEPTPLPRGGEDTGEGPPRTEAEILSAMRKTTRNLIGRAEREGVTVEASKDPLKDLEIYFALQEETYKRHHFVPYRRSFIEAQVKHFSPQDEAIVYIARYQGEPVAASVHMSYAGITSYHHGASTHKYAKIPSSYLLQWTAIKEALHRGDSIYNFWGIAPPLGGNSQPAKDASSSSEEEPKRTFSPKHPFAGVTTFKTGFGGKPLPLMHCVDLPLTSSYKLTRMFEQLRKWRRGF